MYKQTTLKVINCPWYEPGWGCHNELLLASNIPSHPYYYGKKQNFVYTDSTIPPSPYSIGTPQNISVMSPSPPPSHTAKSSHAPHGKHLKQKKWKTSSCEFFEATNLKKYFSWENKDSIFHQSVYYYNVPRIKSTIFLLLLFCRRSEMCCTFFLHLLFFSRCILMHQL